jgi:VCBS repeat-containing protein
MATPSNSKNVSNPPQAVNDKFDRSAAGAATLDVMANDLGGASKSLYSLNQQSPTAAATSASTQLGASISIVNGKVSYAPSGATFAALAVGETAIDTFSYTIQLGNGAFSVATATVTVSGTNDGPVAAADTATTGENQTLVIDALANDTDVDHLDTRSLVSVTGPAGKGQATITDGKVTFAPGSAFDHLAVGQSETVTLTYVMADQHGAQSSSTVTVTVTGQNDGPVAAADVAAGDENQALTIDVLANDTDVDAGDAKALVSVAAPAGKGDATVVDGKVAFAPGSAFDHLAVGQSETVTLTYVMADQHGAQSSSTVTVTVTGQNDGPVAAADVAAGDENQALTIDVLANDTDVDAGDAKALVSVAAPAGKGDATVVDGKVAFAPGSAFDHLAVGQSETVTLTYVMADQHGAQSSSTVTVTVTGQNDGPVAVADVATGHENQALAIDVLANDTDVDAGDAKALISVTAPAGKGVAAIVDGKVLFNPGAAFDHLAAGQTELVTLDYVMQDGQGAQSASTIVVTVTGTNDAPVAAADTAATNEDTAVTITVLANDTDVDGAVLTPSLSTSTTAMGASIAVVNGQVVYNPAGSSVLQALNPGQSVVDTFTYSVADAAGAVSTSTVSVTVGGVSDGGAVNDALSSGEDNRIYIDVLANDVGQGFKQITGLNGGGYTGVSTLGAHIEITNGQVFYNPQNAAAIQNLNSGDTAVDTFTYTMVDSSGVATTATVSVTIAGFTEGTVINSGVTATTTFDAGDGAPLFYTEGGMTVQSFYDPSSGPHLHMGNWGGDGSGDLYNHTGCCSSPYEFRYFNPDNGDTTFSLTSFNNLGGSGVWETSKGSMTISQSGVVDLSANSIFQNVEWVRWHSTTSNQAIDDFRYTA